MDEVTPQSAQGHPVPALLEDIAAQGKAWLQDDPQARKLLISRARSLITALETPPEAVIRLCWAEPAGYSAARTAVAMGLFDKVADRPSVPKSSAQLAAMIGAEARLVSRVAKHLVAMNMLGEAGADQYVATPLSRAWTDPRLRDGISFCFDFHGPIQQGLPSYLAAHGFKDPDDAKDSVCAEALGSDAFTWIAKHPGLLEAFKNHMAGYHIGRPSWMDDGFYPVQDRLVHGFRAGSDAVMLVDVGGATGHDLQELKMKHPHLPGRCVLQDQPAVIAQITRPPDGIEPMSHDFFTPQPVLGARAYFLHSVLHDWNDDKCRKILSQLVPAMTKGYSKILIHENVVPDEGAHWGMTSLDLLMMGVASARERPARQWHELVASVGLKISGIWTKDSACESLIECVWADDP